MIQYESIRRGTEKSYSHGLRRLSRFFISTLECGVAMAVKATVLTVGNVDFKMPNLR